MNPVSMADISILNAPERWRFKSIRYKELNNIVNDLGGSIYLAKDALLNKKQFSLQFNKENKKEFLEFRNPYAKSEQSHRINLWIKLKLF